MLVFETPCGVAGQPCHKDGEMHCICRCQNAIPASCARRADRPCFCKLAGWFISSQPSLPSQKFKLPIKREASQFLKFKGNLPSISWMHAIAVRFAESLEMVAGCSSAVPLCELSLPKSDGWNVNNSFLVRSPHVAGGRLGSGAKRCLGASQHLGWERGEVGPGRHQLLSLLPVWSGFLVAL